MPSVCFAALFEVHASLQCLQHLHTQCGYFLFKVWEVLYCEISLLNSWTDVWKNIFRGFSTVKHSREINSLYQTIFIWHLLICYISIALFWVLRALYIVRGVSPRPPPVCSIHLDDATAAKLRQNAHHTPAYWWRGDRVMKPISVWGWLRGHDGQRPMGKFGQDARVTPLLFFEGHPGIFYDHRESGPRFNISSEGRCFFFFFTVVSPSLYWGARTHPDRRASTPCWPH